jgi:hypothetical protein
MPAVFVALARYYDVAAPDQLFGEFIEEAKAIFKGLEFNKEVLNRARARAEQEQRAFLNRVHPQPDLEVVRGKFQSAAPAGGWETYLTAVFAEEEARLDAALRGSSDDFLRLFPSKRYYQIAARKLRRQAFVLFEDLSKALKLSDNEATNEKRRRNLRDDTIRALEPHLWPRRL